MVMTIENSSEKLESEEVRAKIFNQVSWGRKSSRHAENESAGFFTQSSSRGRGRYRGHQNWRRGGGNKQSSQRGKGENNPCFKCGKFGHFARDCSPPHHRFQNHRVADKVETCDAASKPRSSYHKRRESSSDDFEEEDNNSFQSAYLTGTIAVDKTFDDTWLIDSCASTHMSYNRSLFISMYPSPVNDVKLADNKKLHDTGQGNVCYILKVMVR